MGCTNEGAMSWAASPILKGYKDKPVEGYAILGNQLCVIMKTARLTKATLFNFWADQYSKSKYSKSEKMELDKAIGFFNKCTNYKPEVLWKGKRKQKIEEHTTILKL